MGSEAKVSTVDKGNKLEDDLYEYLLGQKDRGQLVFGVHPSHLCEIYKKKKYFSRDRQDHVTFDVVIEQFGETRTSPHSYLIFECKNHVSAVQDRELRDFSDKLRLQTH